MNDAAVDIYKTEQSQNRTQRWKVLGALHIPNDIIWKRYMPYYVVVAVCRDYQNLLVKSSIAK